MRSKFFSAGSYSSKNGMDYSIQELSKQIENTGVLIDYKFKDGNLSGDTMQQSFLQHDIHFLMHQKDIYEAYQKFNDRNGGKIVPSVKKISGETLQILNNLVESGYDLVKNGWQYASDQEISEKMSKPIHDFYKAMTENPNEKKALDLIANFCGYQYARGQDLSCDLKNIILGNCSSNFVQTISKITALIENEKAYIEFEENPSNKLKM